MRLILDLGCITAKLKITRYVPSSNIDGLLNWCNVDYSLEATPWLKYERMHEEILHSSEIDMLVASIEKLLNGEITESAKIVLDEPDFSFLLYPADISIDWNIGVQSDDGITPHHIGLHLEHNDVKHLLVYLKLIAGHLTTSDSAVRDLVMTDVISWI